MKHYFAPIQSIIATDSDVDENEELINFDTFDGNVVRIPRKTLKDHYREVHISESLKKLYEGYDVEAAYEEMKPIYKGLDDSFHNAEVSALNKYEKLFVKK